MAKSSGQSFNASASAYATPFFLEQESGNKYKLNSQVEKSVESYDMIPFLRSSRKFSPKKASTLTQKSSMMRKSIRTADKAHRTVRKKELGWNSYVKPISQYNEKVHMSMKIPFERI